jgi:hypothetical protein
LPVHARKGLIPVAPEADAFDLKSQFMGILRYATWWQANAGQTTSSGYVSYLVHLVKESVADVLLN